MEYQESIRVARLSMLHVYCQRAKQMRSLARNMLARATILKDLWQQSSGGSRGGGPGARPPLFLEQNEAQRAEKNFLETGPPVTSESGWPPPPPPPHLKVWIRHCSLITEGSVGFWPPVLVSSGSADKSACSTVKLQKSVFNMKKKNRIVDLNLGEIFGLYYLLSSPSFWT